MEKKYYIYAHINPVKNEIFYIGKGTGQRAYVKRKRSNFWNAIRNRYGLVIDILEEGLTNEEACNREKWYINRIGRRNLGKGPLVNMTDGGEGSENRITIITKEHREKLSILRSDLRNKVLKSSLFNTTEFTNDLSEIFINLNKKI